MIGEFVVVQCKCGWLQCLNVKDYKKATLKCFKCNQSSKLHDATKGGTKLNIYGQGKGLTGHKASLLCQELKRLKQNG